MIQHRVLLFTAIIILVAPDVLTGAFIRIYSSTADVSSTDLVPRGSTVVLVCTETPTTQQVDYRYQWSCPNTPCDGQYRKVDGNALVVVATTATSGQYRCDTTPGSDAANHILDLQVPQVGAIYNKEGLLLQNTLFTSLEEIPNGLTCTRRSGSSYVPGFRRESDNTTLGGTRNRQSTVTTVQAVSLQPNGGYWCDADEIKRKFFIYFNNATLLTPQVSVGSTTTDQHLHLLLTTPPTYNSGRFILRYNCTIGEVDIEVEYRRIDIDPGVNSNTVVTRSRSCFVVGEISRVTVWFVNGENISTTPAVVDVDGANITVIMPNRATETTPSTTTAATSTTNSATSTTKATPPTINSATSTAKTTTSPSTMHPAISSQTNKTTSTTTLITNPATSSSTTTATLSDTLVLYIGSGAGCLLLVLVVVLAVIICCVVAVHRRGKRSRSTEHTPTLHYYSTPGHEQEEEPQVQITSGTLEASGMKPATFVELKPAAASFLSGTLYDEVEIKPVRSKPVVVPSEYQLVEAVKEDHRKAHKSVTIPESFYAQPDMTAKSNKKGEKGTTADVEDPDVLHAEVDKPKKKKKKGKEKKEEQPQGDLYAVVDKTSKKKGKGKKTKEKEQQGDGDLYAEVDKTKKKDKKTKQDKESNSFREAVELDSPPPVPDRGLIYEPSADREASDQEQHHHHQLQQQQQQQQQQQEPEQQQEQLQQQEHEEGVEKQELQEQENTGETIAQLAGIKEN